MTMYKNDTREQFFTLPTTRKPVAWDDIKAARPTATQLEILKTKPVIVMWSAQLPCDAHADFEKRASKGIEFVVIHRDLCYYVNTEGYNYVRYAVRLEGYSPEFFLQLLPAHDYILTVRIKAHSSTSIEIEKSVVNALLCHTAVITEVVDINIEKE